MVQRVATMAVPVGAPETLTSVQRTAAKVLISTRKLKSLTSNLISGEAPIITRTVVCSLHKEDLGTDPRYFYGIRRVRTLSNKYDYRGLPYALADTREAEGN